MQELNIDTIIKILRSLNNQITVVRLSSDLDVSPSTIARCKSGKWPHSITLSALCKTFELYKKDFFENDPEKECAEILRILLAMDISTDKYEYIIRKEGYESFISSLVNDAYSHRAFDANISTDNNVDLVDISDDAILSDPTEKEISAYFTNVDYSNSFISYWNTNWFYLFLWSIALIIFALIMNIQEISLLELYTKILSMDSLSFFSITFMLAISRNLVGRYIDTPIAVKKFQKRTGKTNISPQSIVYISKYGSDSEIVPGEGRFNCEKNHLRYALFCNITSNMCAVSFFLSFKSLVTISPSYVTPPPTNFNFFLIITLILSFICAFVSNYYEQTSGYPTYLSSLQENQDNYRQDRIHVIFNNLYLIFNLFFCFSSLIYLAYCFTINSADKIDIRPSYIMIIITSYLFFWFASVSPFAIDYNSTCAGAFIVAPLTIISLSIAGLIFCFKSSSMMIVYIIVVLFVLSSWIFTLLLQKKHDTHKLNIAYKKSIFLALTIMIVIVFLIIHQTLVIRI